MNASDFSRIIYGNCTHDEFFYRLFWKTLYEIFLINDIEDIFNITGNGTMEWKKIGEAAKRKAVSLSSSILYPMLSFLWKLRLTEVPPDILDFIKCRWVASNEKAKKEGKFIPRYTTDETLHSFLDAR